MASFCFCWWWWGRNGHVTQAAKEFEQNNLQSIVKVYERNTEEDGFLPELEGKADGIVSIAHVEVFFYILKKYNQYENKSINEIASLAVLLLFNTE